MRAHKIFRSIRMRRPDAPLLHADPTPGVPILGGGRNLIILTEDEDDGRKGDRVEPTRRPWASARRVVALACDENLRAPDVFGRYGEDDLGVMLPEANEAAGVQLAFRLRNTILQTVLPTVHGPLSMTVSLGVAATVGEVVDLSRLLEHAEQSRQAAVEAGGDCVRGCFVADRRGNLDEALAKLGRRGTDKSAAEAGLVTLSQEEIDMLLDHQAGSR